MRKPDKNRYLRAARHIESEDISFQEDEIDAAVAARILGRRVPMVNSYALPVADFVELNLRCGNDLVFLAHLWKLGRKTMLDAEGREHYVDGVIKTRADLKTIAYPDLDAIRRHIEEVLAAIDGTGLGLKYTPSQAPFLVTTAMGYADYYEAMITDPAFIHEFQKRVEDFCLRELELALSYPIDAVQFGAVLCSKNGPMFSRAMRDEFEYPSLRRRIAMAKAKGVTVSGHFDGNNTELIPELIEIGIEILNPIETCDGAQDIFRLKELYGDKIALHGNIDLTGVLVYGTPGEVRRDTIDHIERLAVGGGYICASSHNITEAVPLENFYAMRDTVHGYRFRRQAVQGQ